MAYGDSVSDSLSAVRAAIARCLTTQSYTQRGRSQQMANLIDLRKMEKELQSESAGSSQMASVGRYVKPVA